MKTPKKKFYFSVVEEGIFGKLASTYRGGRIEIWYKEEAYDVEEIGFILPNEVFEVFCEALDGKKTDFFVIGDVSSQEIEKYVKKGNGAMV